MYWQYSTSINHDFLTEDADSDITDELDRINIVEVVVNSKPLVMAFCGG